MVTLWTSCLNSIGATWAGWKSKQRARGVHCKCFALVHIARSRGRRNLSQPPKSHSVSCVLRMKCLHRSSPEVRRELAARVFHELMRPSFFLVFLIDFSNLIIFGFYLWLFDFSKQLGLFLWQEWGSSFIIQSAGDHSVILQLFLLLQEQSVSSKAADKTPVGHYFRQVSRKFKNVGFWLIFFFLLLILAFYSLQFKCMFIHYLPLSIFITFLCFDGYFYTFAASDTVTTGVAFWTAIFHIPECFRRKSYINSSRYMFLKIYLTL